MRQKKGGGSRMVPCGFPPFAPWVKISSRVSQWCNVCLTEEVQYDKPCGKTSAVSTQSVFWHDPRTHTAHTERSLQASFPRYKSQSGPHKNSHTNTHIVRGCVPVFSDHYHTSLAWGWGHGDYSMLNDMAL